MNKEVPFLDLVAPHRELEDELVAMFRRTLRAADFIGGPKVEEFEEGFARFSQSQYCVGVGSGTDALRFALIAAGVRPGDSVITVPNTFIATTEAISQAGAFPEFVDVVEQTGNMDPRKLEAYLEGCEVDVRTGRPVSTRTGRTLSAIVPVHLYGQMCDMDPLLEIAERYGLLVIEDACQAHGAEYYSETEQRWMRAGSVGVAAAFSFYPGKNLGACGEAGAITTNDERIAQRARQLRDHGQARKYYHNVEGYNGRLDSLQAAVLSAKLPHLEAWNRKRRAHAGRYQQLLEPLAANQLITLPYEPEGSRSVYHLYVVRVGERDEVRSLLQASGVNTAIHYPVPLHLQKAYRALGYRPGDFPVAESLASGILSLPMFPQLTTEQQDVVVDRLAVLLQAQAASLAA